MYHEKASLYCRLKKAIRLAVEICALSKSVQILTSVVDLDPYDPYVYGPPGSGFVIIVTDPDPDLSIIKRRSKKILGFYCFVTCL